MPDKPNIDYRELAQQLAGQPDVRLAYLAGIATPAAQRQRLRQLLRPEADRLLANAGEGPLARDNRALANELLAGHVKTTPTERPQAACLFLAVAEVVFQALGHIARAAGPGNSAVAAPTCLSEVRRDPAAFLARAAALAPMASGERRPLLDVFLLHRFAGRDVAETAALLDKTREVVEEALETIDQVLPKLPSPAPRRQPVIRDLSTLPPAASVRMLMRPAATTGEPLRLLINQDGLTLSLERLEEFAGEAPLLVSVEAEENHSGCELIRLELRHNADNRQMACGFVGMRPMPDGRRWGALHLDVLAGSPPAALLPQLADATLKLSSLRSEELQATDAEALQASIKATADPRMRAVLEKALQRLERKP